MHPHNLRPSAGLAATVRALILVLVFVLAALPVAAQSPAPAAGTPVLLPYVQAGGAQMHAAAFDPSVGVLPPDEVHYDQSYGEWAADWLQWVVLVGGTENPMVNRKGKDCGVNQSGDVWFLAGTSLFDPATEKNRDSVVRKKCVVPSDTALFFPIYTAWFFNDVGASQEDMADIITGLVDQADDMIVTVDGYNLADLWDYRANSGFFDLTLPEGGYYDVLAPGGCGPETEGGPTFDCVGVFESYIDGFWIMLAPLSSGQHTLRFYAHRTRPDGSARALDVTYQLIVE